MITKYKKKNGETAYKFVAYLGVDPITGKQIRTTRQGFKTEREAKRAEIKLIEQYERQGAWKKNNSATFDDIAQLWFEQYQNTVKPSTYLTTEGYYNKQVKPLLGHIKIDKITVLVCQKLVNQLARYRSYGSYISITNRIFRFAVNLGILDSNPMDKVIKAKCTFTPKDTHLENYYEKEELLAFLEIVQKHQSLEELVQYRILAYGGLRVGELLALEDTDFDFNNNLIKITKTLANTKTGWIVHEPKTKKSKRTITMDTETMRLAKEYIRSLPKPLHRNILLFPLRPATFRQRLQLLIKQHSLKPIKPHGFRHTHASLLFEAGIPAKVAQERLGHSKISITMDLYTHLSKTQKDDVADKLSAYIAS
ncbi:tyrosine-type recombinase/integrase [Streptococcus suis]|uniref:site-specific integrase n=1 Tax=Streptococcus suis TaxID=1307 RepID=UPI0039089336